MDREEEEREIPEKENPVNYTLPGVLFFLQQEARNREKEQAEWAVQKALLQVSFFSSLLSFPFSLILSLPLLKKKKTFLILSWQPFLPLANHRSNLDKNRDSRRREDGSSKY